MALTLDPQTQDFGDVNAPPNINITVKESDNLDIEGIADIIDGNGTTVKTERWSGAGKYVYSPSFSDKWDDMVEGPSSVQLTVKSYEPVPEEPINVNSLYLEQSVFSYDGNVKTPVLHGYDSSKMTLFRNTSGMIPGEYTLGVRLLDGYYWSNAQYPYTDLSFKWSIVPGVDYIIIDGNIVHAGETYNINVTELNTNMYFRLSTLSGAKVSLWRNPFSSKQNIWFDSSGNMYLTVTDVGNSNFQLYSPGTNIASSCTINVNVYTNVVSKIIDRVPTQSNELYTNGYTTLYPTWNDYNSNQLNYYTDGHVYPGYYDAIFTPKAGYKWYDGTTAPKTVQWVIRNTYTPPAPVYSNPVDIDPSSVTVSYMNSRDATVWFFNRTSSTVRVVLRGETGYGPFPTFDVYGGTPTYSDIKEIAPYDSERARIIAGSLNLIQHNNSYVNVEYYNPDTLELLGTDQISVYIES